MSRKREKVYKIVPTGWKTRYRKSWLRELINKRRIAKGGVRTISAWELNAVIEEKMVEINTCMENEAVEVLIEEVKAGREI